MNSRRFISVSFGMSPHFFSNFCRSVCPFSMAMYRKSSVISTARILTMFGWEMPLKIESWREKFGSSLTTSIGNYVTWIPYSVPSTTIFPSYTIPAKIDCTVDFFEILIDPTLTHCPWTYSVTGCRSPRKEWESMKSCIFERIKFKVL